MKKTIEEKESANNNVDNVVCLCVRFVSLFFLN